MQITLLQAVLLGFFCFLISTSMFPLGWIPMNMMNKPLVTAMFVGIIMGRVKDALIIGCVIQAAYIGQMSIGGVSTLPNIAVALWFALPLALVSGGDAAETLTICLAYSAVGTAVDTVANLCKIAFLHYQDKLIEDGKIHTAWWFPVLAHVWTLVYCMTVVIVFCLAGSAVVTDLVAKLPPQVFAICTTFTGLLPAIGFMILMVSMIHQPLQWIYFFFGFILAAGLGWSTITITIVACVVAYLIFQFTPKSQAAVAVEEDDD